MATPEFPFALCVEGQWDHHTPKLKNKLTIYFQSKKSGGGDCEVEYSGGQTTVQFKTEEVRQRVLNKQTHEFKIDEKTVKITVRLPSSEASVSQESTSSVSTFAQSSSEVERRREVEKIKPCAAKENDGTYRSAVIENIQNSSQDFLTILVENVLKGCSVESHDFTIEIIPESNCAVVTFSNNKDIEHFIMFCSSNIIIKKKNMKVRLLEITSKVKAEGLPPNLNSDLIMLYFDKFAEVEDDGVTSEMDQSAIITFKNPEDVQKVLKEQHHIKKQPFRVLPYYEKLHTALYAKDRPTLRLPEAFIEKIDRTIWHHLKENRKSLDSVTQAMYSHFCRIDFQSSAVKISPLLSLLNQGGQTRKLIQTWRENALYGFSMSVSKFKSTELHIQKDAWTDIQPEIQKAVVGEAVTLVPYVDEGTIAVAGLKEDVDRIEGILKETVEKITQRIQRKKGSETGEINMTPSIYNLVLCDGLKQQMCDKFPKMNITYHKHSQKLTFYGLKHEVMETKIEILQAVLNLIRKPIELHQCVLHFLHTKDLEEITRDLFFNKGINVALEAEGKRILLVGKTHKALNVGEKQLQIDLGHLSFNVEDPSVLGRSDWHDLVSRIKNTVTNVTVQTTINQVVVSGFVDSINNTEQELYNFVQENSFFGKKSLKSHKTIITFIKDHKTEDWSEEVKGKVNVDFKDEEIVISGPRLYVSECIPLFEDLLRSVHHCTMKIVKPGAKKFFKEKKFMWVAYAKTNMNCLVQLLDEHDNPHEVEAAVKKIYGVKEIKQHGGKDFVIEGVQVDPVFFSICGPSQAEVDETKCFLQDIINAEQVFQSITDTAILTLSDKDQQRIQDLQSTIDVTVRLEYKAHKGSDEIPGEATLTVQGLSRDALKATQEIQDMLKAAKEDEILKREMDYTSELVDWQCEQGGQYKNFDQRTNFELEKALSRQSADIRITFQGQTYQVTLPEGPAVSTTGGNQMKIRRIDKLKATEDIPQHWDAMMPNELCKKFNLQPTNTEYKEVLGIFQATCPNNNVLKIERIQNPGMWKNYQSNKRVMEKKNGHQSNERRLFHGTSEQTLSHIEKSGFNRSNAGKNAAYYGNGTYFALNASYSSHPTYSVPNAQGQKHMYLCRVLTGDFTTGQKRMIVPPAKNANCDPYDTVVDNPRAPTIFVVFRDDNAYPEYLITFS